MFKLVLILVALSLFDHIQSGTTWLGDQIAEAVSIGAHCFVALIMLAVIGAVVKKPNRYK